MPDEHHPHPMSDRDRARLDRLEESLAFTERTVEQLSAEIADMNRRVLTLTKRLAMLEQRLDKSQDGAADASKGPIEPDRPPDLLV